MMPFSLLLVLLSLVVIIPIIFVLVEKSKTANTQHSQQHQKFLTQNTKAQLHQINPQLATADKLSRYQRLALPNTLRKQIARIKTHYQNLSLSELHPEQHFMVDKLMNQRLPEILADYMALDADYATTVIIDTTHNLTSLDITQNQLDIMIDFLHRIHADGQKQLANTVLANRVYLNAVHQEFYPDAPKPLATHAYDHKSASIPSFGNDNRNDSGDGDGDGSHDSNDSEHNRNVMDVGLGYLQQIEQMDGGQMNDVLRADFDTPLGNRFLSSLGDMVTIAEHILAYEKDFEFDEQFIHTFDAILSQHLPRYLLICLERMQQQTNDAHPTSQHSQTHQTHQAHEPRQTHSPPKNTPSSLPDMTHHTHAHAFYELADSRVQKTIELLGSCESALKAWHDQHILGRTQTNSPAMQQCHATLRQQTQKAVALIESGFFNP